MSVPRLTDVISKFPAADGYSETPMDMLSRFKPAIGVDITRPRGTARIIVCDVTFPIVTRVESNRFTEWWETETLQGSERFIWQNPRTLAWAYYKFTENQYTIRDVGGLRDRISMQIVRLPGPDIGNPYV